MFCASCEMFLVDGSQSCPYCGAAQPGKGKLVRSIADIQIPQVWRTVAAIFYTATHWVEGTLKISVPRLADSLNSASTTYLSLKEGRHGDLRALTKQSLPFRVLQVNKAQMVMAVPRDQLPEEEDKGKPYRVVPKRPYKVAIWAPPFRLEGFVHLLPDIDPGTAMGAIDTQFLAITTPSVESHLPGYGAEESPAILLNVANISAIEHLDVDSWEVNTPPRRETPSGDEPEETFTAP